MKFATWRLAAGLTLLGLAACKSSPGETATPKPVATQPAPAAQPAESAGPTPPARPADAAPVAAPVAATALAKAELGQPAPDFTLTDLDGKTHKLSDHRGKIVVLEWFSPACPNCVYAYSEGPLAEQPERLAKEGVVWLSVNSQNPNHPGSKPERNRAFVQKYGLKAPLLLDPTGVVGRAYGAKTTPHCFVIDARGVLAYAGGLDNAPNGQVEGGAEPVNHVDAAIADLRAGRPVTTKSTRAYG